MRALIVDENVQDRAALMQAMQRAGYVSTAVDSAEQAREVLEVQAFDVLLLESHLPDEDGFQLCNEIRERLGEGMIIMFISQRNTSVARTLGIQLGADDYLGKPCDEEELVERIRARQRRRGPA